MSDSFRPLDCSPPRPSVHGILQARILEWVPIPFSRGSSWPRDQTQVSGIACRFFIIWAIREAFLYYNWVAALSMLLKGSSHLSVQFSSVQSLSHVWLFATPWITAHQASLPITNSQSSLKLTSIESVMPSSHLILCHPLLLLPPIPPCIRVFSNELTFRRRWPKYWSFSFGISASNEHPELISFK